MYKKKVKKRNKIIVFSIVIGLIFLFIGLNYFLPNGIGNIGHDGVNVFEILISKPVLMIKNKFNKEKKTNILDESNNEIMLDENTELKKEIEDLKEQLKLNTILSSKNPINATITSRNLEYWYSTITIDKGTNDGIKDGMGVLYKGYLVGKVSNVSYTSSTIKLLSNNEDNSKTSVKISIKNKDIYGLLVGYKDGKYIVEGISDMDDVPLDSVVSTTGLGDLPSGIVIGKVSGVSTDNFDLAKTIEVTPSVDTNDMNYVIVVSK